MVSAREVVLPWVHGVFVRKYYTLLQKRNQILERVFYADVPRASFQRAQSIQVQDHTALLS